jgi:hypothetical protein
LGGVFSYKLRVPNEECPGGDRAADVPCNGGAVPISYGPGESFPVPIAGTGPGAGEDPLHGALPLELYENDARCAAVGFDFGSLDDVEGFLREMAEAGRPLRPIIEAMVAEEEMRIRCEAVCWAIGLVLKHEKKGLAVYALAEASGLTLIMGLSQQDIADKAGVSKQDVQQLSKHFRKLLRLRKTRTQRDEESSARMSAANHRHRKL